MRHFKIENQSVKVELLKTLEVKKVISRLRSIKTVPGWILLLTLLPIIATLSVGVSNMSLIVIILLLTSLLLGSATDWDDKRVVSSNSLHT